ncbi:hypothetical protein BO71DRAFT_436126 [Aspergillus ellipticus CBS 707.79]|uniref:FAD-binding FR-type domain-containing protein n=1 Tax=Aspergillus ellipticus CBS 707.79 TaxID=1448320 RepID=A0A319CTL2_9EURO|nr:hypothetical protein BO71DRAFT_436126 [Aspergillus ellipticus CBS 707.79]
MKGIFTFLVLCCICTFQVHASSDKTCFEVILSALDSLSWGDSSSECNNTAEVTSIYTSAKLYCTETQMTALTSNITNVNPDDLPILDPETEKSNITEPGLLEYSYFKRALRSKNASNDTKPQAKRLGWALMGYWGGIILLGILQNAWKTCFQNRHATPQLDQEQGNSARKASRQIPLLSPVSHFITTHFIIPRPFGRYTQTTFCGILARWEAIVVAGFWIVCILVSCVRYESFTGNTSTPKVSQQVWNSIATRLGILAYHCLPFLWMFAGRNNIFIWATGWSFSTFNVFHRHIARATILLAILHSIAETIRYTVNSSKYEKSLKKNWFVMGIVATVLFSLLIPLSSVWLRKRSYELFLIIHVTFNIVILYSLFIHTSKFDGEFNGYLWPLVAIWAFDRSLRVFRLIYCNLRVHLHKGLTTVSKTTVTYNPSTDVIRIDMQSDGSVLKPGPGQYYFLYQPLRLRGWENHPFTLGHYITPSDASQSRSQTSDSLAEDKQPSQTIVRTSSGPERTTLTFWVRPYDGWTRRLRDECKSQNGSCHPTLLLEGPYGHHEPLHTFDTLVMIAGGTGISAVIPYLQELVAKSGRSRVSRIEVNWVVKQKAFVDELMRGELGELVREPVVRARFWCTTATAEGSGCEKDDREGVVGVGRPSIQEIVSQVVAEEEEGGSGRVGVLVCGPAGMASGTRSAVHEAMRGGCRGISYFEETYGW